MSLLDADSSYWRLSSFYFLYFACLGVMVPYWSLYLEAVGLGAPAIGAVLAAGAATRIVGPNFWGWLGDRSGKRLRIIRLTGIAALLTFAGLLAEPTFGWLLLVVVIHTFFWNGIIAQYEAITLSALGAEVHRYGLVRMWGSVSFVLTVVGAGALFDRLEVRHLPWVMLVLFATLVGGSFAIRDVPAPPRSRESGRLHGLLANRTLWAFLGAAFLMQAAHGPYYGFFSLLLDRSGYDRAQTGYLWALGVLAEVVLFAFAHRLLLRYTLRALALVSLLLAALRWLMIGLAIEVVPVLVVAQLLHAASFGCFHAVGVEYVRRHFGVHHQGQGQALYSAVSFGAGGAVGAFASGWLWELQPQSVFVFAALAALAGAWIVHAQVRIGAMEAGAGLFAMPREPGR